MKILVFSQYFYPENFRINALCRELVRRGHTVTVVTGYPQYPLGEIYEGYGFDIPYEPQWEGVHIQRVKVPPRGKGLVGMLKNMVGYVLAANRWVRKCTESYDAVYVFEVSPVTVGLPAVAYGKKFRVPVLFNLQDLWPENVEEVLGIRFPPVIWTINRVVDHIYAGCHKILCTSRGFVENLRRRGVPEEKLRYWPQFCEEPLLEHVPRPDELREENLNIVFAGNLGDAQGLDLLVRAARELKGSPIRWYLVGDGRARVRLEQLVQELEVTEEVIFVGRVSTQEADRWVHYADFAYLSFQDNKIFNMTIPAKLQTYLACGTPILAAAGGESVRLIRENGCGLVSRAELGELVTTLKAAANLTAQKKQNMSEAARNCYLASFTMEKLVDELEEILAAAVE